MPRRELSERQPIIGWPAERIAAVGAGVLLVLGASSLAAGMSETFTRVEVPDAIEAVGTASIMAGFSVLAVQHRIAQARGTAPDRNYDQCIIVSVNWR